MIDHKRTFPQINNAYLWSFPLFPQSFSQSVFCSPPFPQTFQQYIHKKDFTICITRFYTVQNKQCLLNKSKIWFVWNGYCRTNQENAKFCIFLGSHIPWCKHRLRFQKEIAIQSARLYRRLIILPHGTVSAKSKSKQYKNRRKEFGA